MHWSSISLVTEAHPVFDITDFATYLPRASSKYGSLYCLRGCIWLKVACRGLKIGRIQSETELNFLESFQRRILQRCSKHIIFTLPWTHVAAFNSHSRKCCAGTHVDVSRLGRSWYFFTRRQLNTAPSKSIQILFLSEISPTWGRSISLFSARFHGPSSVLNRYLAVISSARYIILSYIQFVS